MIDIEQSIAKVSKKSIRYDDTPGIFYQRCSAHFEKTICLAR